MRHIMSILFTVVVLVVLPVGQAYAVIVSSLLASSSEDEDQSLMIDREMGIIYEVPAKLEKLDTMSPEEKQACSNPGKEVSVGQLKSIDKVSFFYYTLTQKVLICEGNVPTIVEKPSEPKFVWWPILLFIGIVLFVISNVFFWKKRAVYFPFTLATILVFALALVCITAFAPFIVLGFTFATSIATTVTVHKKLYWFFSGLTYLSAVASLVVWGIM